MLLEMRDVHVFYDKVEVLKGVSLYVEEGEIITLIGANGAGKTTTLHTLSGLKRIATGEIFWHGRRIDTLTPQQIVALGMAHIPEGRRVFPFMTVHENLLLGAYHRKDRARIREDLNNMHKYFPILKERARQKAGSLSGGEQQMLVVARALMSRPKLLLMDEPTLGMSPKVVDQIADIIRTISQQGVSIILVEQNAMMALELADRGYVIEIGNVVLTDRGSDLISNEHVQRAYLGG